MTRDLVPFFSLLSLFALGCGGDDAAEGDGGADDAECGSLADGDTDISGFLAIDGTFEALLTLRGHADAIAGDFEDAVDAQLGSFGIEGGPEMILESKVAELKAEIEAQFSAHLDGGIAVDFLAPRCTSAIPEARAAMHDCEAGAGCEVADPEGYATECQGKCHGICDSGGDGFCVDEEFDGACDGTCMGPCTPSTGTMDCSGLCDGDCLGTCHGSWDGATCLGWCCGDCDGACENPVPTECEGACAGSCTTVLVAADLCEEVFDGSCLGYCDGECWGDAVPPTMGAEAECDASWICRVEAVCTGRVGVACTTGGGGVAICYEFGAAVGADAQAEFEAKMAAFREALDGILVGYYELRDLVGDGPYGSAAAGLDEAFATISSELEGGGLDGWVDAAHRPCVPPAIAEAEAILDSIEEDGALIIEAQRHLLDVLTIE